MQITVGRKKMINAINSTMQMPMPRSEPALTEDQQQVISETLSQFDAENLTEADAQSIIETLSSADIRPSRALESALSELGFDAKSLGELAKVNDDGNRPPPPPPPKQSTEEISGLVDYLTELLEEKLTASDAKQLSDEDRQEIYAEIKEKFGLSDNDSIIKTTA